MFKVENWDVNNKALEIDKSLFGNGMSLKALLKVMRSYTDDDVCCGALMSDASVVYASCKTKVISCYICRSRKNKRN
jgi:hypothetical protein